VRKEDKGAHASWCGEGASQEKELCVHKRDYPQSHFQMERAMIVTIAPDHGTRKDVPSAFTVDIQDKKPYTFRHF